MELESACAYYRVVVLVDCDDVELPGEMKKDLPEGRSEK